MDSVRPLSGARRALLTLSLVPGIGPQTRRRLLERFETAEAVLRASAAELRATSGVGPELAERVRSAATLVDVDEEVSVCRRHGIQIVTEQDVEYPRLLHEIHDPPGVLFMRGDLRDGDRLSMAMVGTRHATAYGRRQAERLAAGLARAGLTIVSGLARGIDAAAHRGALDAGGRTLAVLGSGLLNLYPPEHADLAADIARSGAVISELPPLRPPHAKTFPQRNRLISGLSLGVIVVEAAERSGALISAEHAMEQGRDVFAVPGRVDSRVSRGCHQLIRDGARLVESVEDVLEELGPLVESVAIASGMGVRRPAELLLTDQEQRVLGAVGDDPTAIDDVIATTEMPVPRVLATLSVLEMRRLIVRLSGQWVTRI